MGPETSRVHSKDAPNWMCMKYEERNYFSWSPRLSTQPSRPASGSRTRPSQALGVYLIELQFSVYHDTYTFLRGTARTELRCAFRALECLKVLVRGGGIEHSNITKCITIYYKLNTKNASKQTGVLTVEIPVAT